MIIILKKMLKELYVNMVDAQRRAFFRKVLILYFMVLDVSGER